MLSEIEVPDKYNTRHPVFGMFRLSDDTLLCVIGVHQDSVPEGDPPSSKDTLLLYRSTDNGTSWEEPSPLADLCYEGGLAQLPSGKLLAVLRYQPSIAGLDFGDVSKMLFLSDSDDQGRSWQNLRQLTTVRGQCYGFPAALSDGTVVVTHDCRYGPYPPSCRAMISYDEGQTWEDEVYYMYCGETASGYVQNVVLEDDLILTICGTSDYEGGNPGAWDNWIGNSDLTAIRWKPESRG